MNLSFLKLTHIIDPMLNGSSSPVCFIVHVFVVVFVKFLVCNAGVQTNQGAGSDGPTVTDITAGESVPIDAGGVNGWEKMCRVLPTMWLGAQSGWYDLFSSF